MITHAKKYLPNITALMTGFTIAIIFAPIVLATADWYAEWRDANNPPATLEWNALERLDADTLRITLLVTRHEDCLMARAQAYSGNSPQAMHPARSFGREDGEQPQSYPVGITVVSRPWIMRGVYGKKLAVSAYYDCDDRIVKAPLLTGDVPEFKP